MGSDRDSSRGLLFLLLSAGLRALALGVVALFYSAPEPRFWGAFLLTWWALLLPAELLLCAIEWPLWSGLGSARGRPGAVIGALLGLTWGFLLVALAPIYRSLGALGVLGRALAAGAVAWRFAPRGGRRKRSLLLGLGLVASVVLGALVVDPEAGYNARYAENELSTAELSAAPPVPGTERPDELSARSLALAVARTFMRSHPPGELRWSWEETVAVEGLLAVARVTGDPEPVAYARAWVEAHAELAKTETLWADACAPAIICLGLRAWPEQEAGALFVRRVRRYVEAEAPRTRAGALSHVGVLAGGVLPTQAWADSLFMHGVFLNRLARSGDTGALERSEALGRGMLAELQDADSGLLRHALLELGPARVALPVEGCFWARAQGWALWYLVDYLALCRARGRAPDAVLAAAADRLMDAVLERQDTATGLFATDLSASSDRRGALLESSASALFAASFERAARELGGLGRGTRLRRAAAAARRGLRKRIRWDRGHPSLTGTSVGTHPGFRAYYESIAARENVGHGIGALLLALSEAAR